MPATPAPALKGRAKFIPPLTRRWPHAAERPFRASAQNPNQLQNVNQPQNPNNPENPKKSGLTCRAWGRAGPVNTDGLGCHCSSPLADQPFNIVTKYVDVAR